MSCTTELIDGYHTIPTHSQWESPTTKFRIESKFCYKTVCSHEPQKRTFNFVVFLWNGMKLLGYFIVYTKEYSSTALAKGDIGQYLCPRIRLTTLPRFSVCFNLYTLCCTIYIYPLVVFVFSYTNQRHASMTRHNNILPTQPQQNIINLT